MSVTYPGLTRFDPSEYLETEEALAEYMNEALEEGDPAFVADAISVVARARGMSEIARLTGLSRERLYLALGAADSSESANLIQVAQTIRQRFGAVCRSPKAA